jgi:surface protein
MDIYFCIHLNTKIAMLEDLRSQLIHSVLPLDIINIISNYLETSIKVEFSDNQIIYLKQSEFENLDCKDVINIYIYGVLVLLNPIAKFKFSKIQTITGDVILIGNINRMFFFAKDFNSNINKWDTKDVVNMNNVFNFAIKFNSDLSNWNTENVTDMSYMFCSTRKFNSDISNWNTANVTNINYMFYEALDFNYNLSNWNTSKVTEMSYVFCNATSFSPSSNVRFSISNWNTSKVTDLRYMFYNARNFNSNISNWNTTSATDMSYIFDGSIKFKGRTIRIGKTWKITYTG